MSLREDLRMERLERLERREKGEPTPADLSQRLARLAPAVTETNGRIAAVNALLPDDAGRIPAITWRPNPNNKRILRAPKWRRWRLDWLTSSARSDIGSVESRLEYLLRRLGPDGPGVDATDLDLTLREIRLDIRDVDATGKEIDSRPKFNDWAMANPVWILGGLLALMLGSTILLVLSRIG